MKRTELVDVERQLSEIGLSLRGAFRPEAGDAVPALPGGEPARTVVLAGNAGPRMWRQFAPIYVQSAISLDDWSRQVLTQLADRLGACAVYPFERPYLPFLRWAMRAQTCHASPLGLLIDPDYGVWHGYRGALLFSQELKLVVASPRPHPCLDCPGRPCLSACPVRALSGSVYDVPACVRHLSAAAGATCMEIGCLARHACPVGRAHRYEPAQAQFHMRAFLRNHWPAPARGAGVAQADI